jgi:hypothetical protein
VFRRFLIAVLIFVIAVIVVADRVGAIAGAHVLAGKVQSAANLPSRPTATIGGFPFLTQALRGNYQDVTITANNLPLHGVTVTTLTAHLHGMHVPLHDVLHGTVSEVPVDRIDGTALMSFASVNSYLASQQLTPRLAAGVSGHAVVTERTGIRGKRVLRTGVAAVTVSDNAVHVRVAKLSAPGHRGHTAVRFSVPLTGLPFQLQVTSVAVSPVGLTASGSAQHVVLDANG